MHFESRLFWACGQGERLSRFAVDPEEHHDTLGILVEIASHADVSDHLRIDVADLATLRVEDPDRVRRWLTVLVRAGLIIWRPIPAHDEFVLCNPRAGWPKGILDDGGPAR